MLFLLQISLKNKVYEGFRHKKNKVVLDTTSAHEGVQR